MALLRTGFLSLGLLASVLAGCVAGPEGGSDAGQDPASGLPDLQPVWVHLADGVAVAPERFGGALPRFEQVTASQRVSGEPTLAVTRTGALVYAAIDFDAAGGLPRTLYLRSVDNGASWHDVSPSLGNAAETHPVSGDPYVYADPTTGRLFAIDMGVQAECNTLSYSNDDGNSWVTRPLACPMPGVNDHPTLFAGPRFTPVGLRYPNMLYLCTNQVAETQCSASPDGGVTWLPSQPVYFGARSDYVNSTQPAGPDPTEELPPWVCSAFTGHGHASFVDGTLYLGKAHCGEPQVAVSRDGGLNWANVVVSAEAVHRTRDEHDVMVASDAAGTAYATWVGNAGRSVYVAVSRDRGATWETPINVTAPGVTAAKQANIVAGEAGRIAFNYVGTTTPLGWAVGETDDDGNLKHRAEWLNATWNQYVGMSLGASGDAPVFATTTVNRLDQPVKRGGCDDRCFGNRGGMYDFQDIEVDPLSGRVWPAFVDVCTVDCDAPGANATAFQRSFGAVGKQVAGPMLLDRPIERRR